ncbi:hypothetical protein JTE90_011152 [Oedothorax gibbosus]|uniref:Uncharacterized protein n=1 Tax=Oedothorax gibbosus TaxID=931172 RepID=A0AAV6U0F9_9ARAC|nr:hypothetical protein JTE90_011152 [Oedothorax gibbosus]
MSRAGAKALSTRFTTQSRAASAAADAKKKRVKVVARTQRVKNSISEFRLKRLKTRTTSNRSPPRTRCGIVGVEQKGWLERQGMSISYGLHKERVSWSAGLSQGRRTDPKVDDRKEVPISNQME